MEIFQAKRSFIREFKRQLRLSIMAAIGFTIAFAWRDAIFNTFQNFVSRFLDVSPEHYLSENYTALSITIAGVIAIFITTKILKD